MTEELYPFRSQFGLDIFESKGYKKNDLDTWPKLIKQLVNEVPRLVKYKYGHLSYDELNGMEEIINRMMFIPGGRYLYYTGRPVKYYNNCFLFNVEHDTREEWAQTALKNTNALMTGGGCGNVYTNCRAEGTPLKRTGGTASGPIRLMIMVNDLARHIIQGGARRAAEWAGLHWYHKDIEKFLNLKNSVISPDVLTQYQGQLMDCTNISVIYDTEWLKQMHCSDHNAYSIFRTNILQAMKTGEPGFSFRFFDYEKLVLANACTEVISEDDSDVCNLGSINLSRIETIEQFATVVELATKFLICGSLTADLPSEKTRVVREQNRLLGLGLMGVHEWLLMRGYKYEMNSEFRRWLEVYRDVSNSTAEAFCNRLGISIPKRKRAIAPTGSIAILAGTTSGIEPIFSVAYKRTYLGNKLDQENQSGKGFDTKPITETIIDDTAKYLIAMGINPDKIETSFDLSIDYERRIKMQYDMQVYVDNAISSTINLPAWGSEYNNESTIDSMTQCVQNYCTGLRGLTFYPNGARAGQPLVPIEYKEALKSKEQKIITHDICSIANKSTCG